jgi:hydroxymethylbilane synthase
MVKVIKIGTRTSPLALKQVEEFKRISKRINNTVEFQIVGIDTYGDKDKKTSISVMEGTDFFTREIDDALLYGRIDFALHSAKDLPDVLREGLAVAAITSSIDPYDVLVSKNRLKLDKFPFAAKIGTSSIRRKKQLKEYRKDFQIVDIRGNIHQRLEILDNSMLDAIVIAAAGLIRLGLEDRITQKIPLEIMEPHPLQGCLAAVVRENDVDTSNLLRKILSETRDFKKEKILIGE